MTASKKRVGRDRRSPPRVYVTGLGVVSSIGLGRAAFARALHGGQSGLGPVTLFDTHILGRTIGAEVHGFRARDHLTVAEAHRMGRCSAMALAAARMALADAGLDRAALCGARVAVVLGTTMGDADVLTSLDHAWIKGGTTGIPSALLPRYGATLLPIHVARAIGAEGMVLALPAACSAGNYAIGFASDVIRAGRADVVVSGASDLLQELQFSGFVRLAAMAPDRCRPFDLNREGLILGEGAGILVLESEEHAVRRGATAQAEVRGYGLSCDAHHITRPHPDATGSVVAMREALERSGLLPGEVDFINAHGTGTKMNDVVETKLVQQVFGDRRVPISSIKSMLGHCMGAASALEAISCVLTIGSGEYPPTIGYETPDPQCNVDVVANISRRGPSNVVVNNSLAFGGYNAVTCFSRPDHLPPVPVHAA
jgi:3-oxoacyl-[acyl-carrier-protein] synthase II